MNYQSNTFGKDLNAAGDIQYSRTTPRTIYGLRVAVAGLSPETLVQRGPDIDFSIHNVGDLRKLSDLPYRLEVLGPFRIQEDSVVAINRCYED